MKKSKKMFFGVSAAIFIILTAGCKIDASPDGTTSDTTPPGEVSSLNAAPGNEKITLSWNEPEDSDYAGASIYNGSTLLYKVKKNTTSVIITDLSNGTEYTFTVKTYDTSGNESAGTTVTATPVSDEKAITVFKFDSLSVEGVIDTTLRTVTISVPYGTDVTALVATFSITGAKLSVGTAVQESGTTENDFSTPVTYTVTAADGTTQDYTVTVTANDPGVYTVSFNKNADTAAGTMTAQNITQDKSAELTSCSYTRTGYAFAGWAETPSGTVAYADGGTCTMGASNVILYAVWTPVSFTITYGNITSDSTNSNPATYTIGTATITLADPVRSGYTFGGWYGSTTFDSDKKVTQIAEGTTGNIALYAQWTPVSYTITYELNGDTSNKAVNADSNPLTYTIETTDITLAAPARDNYTFAGWYTDKNFANAVSTPAVAKGSTGDKSFYAKWTPVSYTITYGNITSDSTNSNPATYTIETATITLADPVMSGYTFGGWYGSTTFDADKKVTQIAKGTTGNIALYAQWTPNHGISATVSIPAGTITFSPESPTVTKGSSLTLSVSETSYKSYTWRLDGAEQTNGENPSSLVISTVPLSAGVHTVQLVVTDSSGNTFSGTCRFSVTN
jgi:uncharacterized repeat protein (TIGR02543 family)